MCRCYQCNREIRFVKRKGEKAIPVEPQRYYFVPCEKNEGDVFLSQTGVTRHGNLASDGLPGYKWHKCPKVIRKSA